MTVVNARFEDWQPVGEPFDIVFAVTSWHWLDPRVRYAGAAAALRAGCVLAFTTGGHAFPAGFDSFFTEIQACYDALGFRGIDWPPPRPEADAREEIGSSGFFHDVHIARRVWTDEFTADEYVAVMSTASDHCLMEPAKREQLFAEMRRLIAAHGSRIRKHNLTILHLARKGAKLNPVYRPDGGLSALSVLDGGRDLLWSRVGLAAGRKFTSSVSRTLPPGSR